MGEWVLVLLFIGQDSGSVGLVTEIFSNKTACEFALEGAREKFKRGTVEGYCTPKTIADKR